jgi:hypothetical protein
MKLSVTLSIAQWAKRKEEDFSIIWGKGGTGNREWGTGNGEVEKLRS